MPEELREYDRSALIEEVIIPFIDHLLEGVADQNVPDQLYIR